jgi:nucleoside phosphorylase
MMRCGARSIGFARMDIADAVRTRGPVLLVAADLREFEGLLNFCRDVRPLRLPVHWARGGSLNGREVLLIANGAGGTRAAEAVDAALSVAPVEMVCSVGFCGALEKGMRPGEIFVANRVQSSGREYAVSVPSTGRPHHTGVLASIDRVAQTAREKSDLRATGASAVEMEAGGAATRAAELGLKFYCVRSVTDLAEEGFRFDFNAALRSDGRFDTMRLIAAACRRPRTLLPELLRLRRRCRLAAETLGEFIADCGF